MIFLFQMWNTCRRVLEVWVIFYILVFGFLGGRNKYKISCWKFWKLKKINCKWVNLKVNFYFLTKDITQKSAFLHEKSVRMGKKWKKNHISLKKKYYHPSVLLVWLYLNFFLWKKETRPHDHKLRIFLSQNFKLV